MTNSWCKVYINLDPVNSNFVSISLGFTKFIVGYEILNVTAGLNELIPN